MRSHLQLPGYCKFIYEIIADASGQFCLCAEELKNTRRSTNIQTSLLKQSGSEHISLQGEICLLWIFADSISSPCKWKNTSQTIFADEPVKYKPFF